MATTIDSRPTDTDIHADAPTPDHVPTGRDWRAAWGALRKLLADGNDTLQVFRIMRALNGDTTHKNYRKLLDQPGGGAIAYRRIELTERFADRAWLDSFPEGSVGAHYRAFLDKTGYSAQGLADISRADNAGWRDMEHPYAWYGRRERDTHDLWHILTGYTAEEHLGEACLVAFSFAQTRGLGWGFIAGGAALKSLRQTHERKFAAAVLEGFRHGKRAKWLPGEDYIALMEEPLEAARKRLGIAEPVKYHKAQTRLAEQGLAGI